MALDLNDPNTWPDDLESLSALAQTADAGEASAAPEDSESKAEPPEQTGTGADKAGDDVQAQGAAAAEPGVKGSAAAAGGEGEQTIEVDGLPVLTRDGKHLIPSYVLKQLRDENRDLRAQLSERATAAATATPESQPEPAESAELAKPAVFALTDDQKALVERMREQWGEEIASQFERNFRLEWQVEQQSSAQTRLLEELQRVREHEQHRSHRETRSEEEQVQAAIDDSPLLAAWQSEKDGVWFDRSTKVHQMLIGTDPAYARMSWTERFQALPGRVEAVYGQSQAGAEIAKQQPSGDQGGGKKTHSADVAAVAGAKLAAAEAARVPVSMSELGGGGEGLDVPEVTRLERLNGAALNAHIAKLEREGKLAEYLAALSPAERIYN